MRLLYISEGDIPSRFAHATQGMMMASAFSAEVAELNLLTAGTLTRRWPSEQILAWYGIEPTFSVVRLPVAARNLPFLEQQSSTGEKQRQSSGWKNRFVLAANMYALWWRPDLINTRCCRVGRYAASLGLPVAVEYHGSGTNAARQLKQAPLRQNLRAIVTVSEHIREDFVSHGIPAEKILVEPGGVDLAPFAETAPRYVARKQLGLPTDRHVVMYCGHFYEKKGVRYLIDVARCLPGVCFCLVGGWPEDIARLQHLAGDAANVILPGFVSHSEVPTFLAAADLLVLPNSARFSHAFETCPLKLFEYAAARRPIVASRIPGINCLVDHGQQAWLTDPDSPQDLQAGIERVLKDSTLASRLASQAHLWVQQFSWHERAKRILKQAGFPSKTMTNVDTRPTRKTA